MRLDGKRVNLAQLYDELTAAGIAVQGLGTDGDDLHTYDDSGAAAPLPQAAEAIVLAHVPPAAYVAPDYGADAVATTGDQLAQAVTSLRQFLALASPTQAQSLAALKLTIRLALLLARRSIVRPGGR